MAEVRLEVPAQTDSTTIVEAEEEATDKMLTATDAPPWADEPLLPNVTAPDATRDDQAPDMANEEGKEPDTTKSTMEEVTEQTSNQTDGHDQVSLPNDMQAVQQFNGQYPIHYPHMTPHGPQPYYHDPMMQAQYHHHHLHPHSGFLNQMPNPPGTKAKRKRASPHQLALLNQIFEYTFFPSTELRNAIGKELGMAPRTVQIWFQNRRQAWRSTKTINADGTESATPKSNDNERGGWEVLRSFQARRANGEIQEYEYMAIPSPSQAGGGANGEGARVVGGYSLVPYHPGMMQVALSSNDQFNSSMQQVPMPLPHTPRPMPIGYPGPPAPAPTTTTTTTTKTTTGQSEGDVVPVAVQGTAHDQAETGTAPEVDGPGLPPSHLDPSLQDAPPEDPSVEPDGTPVDPGRAT